jgi:hypothetical protein
MGRAKYTADIIREARKIKKQVDSLVDESKRMNCGPPDWRPFVGDLAALVEQLAVKIHEGA